MKIFRLTMLPASEGDCLILSYGADADSLNHIVIDAGRKTTWLALKGALASIAARDEPVVLMVLSHIDADHIDGAFEMIQARDCPIPPPPLWFNGFDQLRTFESSGAMRLFGFPVADAYSRALADKGWRVNAEFDGKLVCSDTRPEPFAFDGLTLTLVSPTLPKLKRLWKEWRTWRDPAAGGAAALAKRPMPAVLDVEALNVHSAEDTATPNGSSIAFLAEYDGRRVLLGADAHPDVLAESLGRLAPAGGRLPIDLIKLPHHGSRANVTPSWLDSVDSRRFAVSTNGSNFGHPDPEAISRILKSDPTRQKTFYFNYASDRTTPWDAPDLRTRWRYDCVFPQRAGEPLVIDI